MFANTAAYLTGKGQPLEVKSAPYSSPGEHQIVIKSAAVAINPVDWAQQNFGEDLFPQFTYPAIIGSDVAGEVVEVGSAVSRFNRGDRVVGLCPNFAAKGAFQAYPVLQDHLAAPIPSSLSYERAAVIPLGLCTAAAGLYQKEYLALQHPSVSISPNSTGKALLIWGGATSVGSNAIQLAVASSYEVITTASPKNFDYVKKLGVSQVLDYISKTVVDDLVDAFRGKTVAGAFKACADVLLKTEGGKFIAPCRPLPPPEKRPESISAKFILGSNVQDNEVGPAVWVDFLPQALEQGKFLAAPEPVIARKGLKGIQGGVDLWAKGVSAQKVVVSL